MEIRVFSGAQNIHSPHGTLHRTTTGSIPRFITETDGLLESQSDNNNNSSSNSSGPRTPSLHLLAAGNGSKPQPTEKATLPGNNRPILGLHNAGKDHELDALLGSQELVRTGWKYGLEGGAEMQMALFEGEEEPSPQPREPSPFPGVRRDDGASKPADKPPNQELYVVFNVVQEEGEGRDGEPSKHRPDVSSSSEDPTRGKRLPECSRASCSSTEAIGSLESQALRKNNDVFSLLTETCASKQQVGYHQTVEDVVLTNKYGDKICGQICTDNNKLQSRGDEALIPGDSAGVEAMDTSDFIGGSTGLQGGGNPPASETFSGTITINNQSIIVTIENGILTLAAPPEGSVHREDDMVSLKEHLGMKDHEDIVLLNYDSGTKSIGKISTLALTSTGPEDEPRPGLSVSDSELALVDDCSLSELGTALDSCPVVKQEAGALCDLVTPSPKAPPLADCESGDFQAIPLIRSKKETSASSFGCPEPECSSTFDSRQKLKVHLLHHADDPRPYRCLVEGCGWAFATSYKLKRHLQSHDKQRPHSCTFEGCGRRFTTVYNLKAHVKVHEQDDAFVCQVCSERFRSATRLNNHQKVHFEPQRPHKCEFLGCEKTFITFSALFSHNRTHFRETGHFTCNYPGCDKTYDKACRLKIHMRSHTGERPFVCDSEGCGWSFTSMSKLLRHKRKHEDDRRFVCTEEGCGKSFTRAEHLKGHSITHLGTKPFQCHAEGCNAKFSARSSLYIHSKKHKQDASSLRTRCPVNNCSKNFSSRSSLKTHILKHHHISQYTLNTHYTTHYTTLHNTTQHYTTLHNTLNILHITH